MVHSRRSTHDNIFTPKAAIEHTSSDLTLYHASRRGKKGLKSSRDNNEGAYRSREGEEEPA